MVVRGRRVRETFQLSPLGRDVLWGDRILASVQADGGSGQAMLGHLPAGSVLWTVWHGVGVGGRGWMSEQAQRGGTGPGSISAGGRLINHKGAT